MCYSAKRKKEKEKKEATCVIYVYGSQVANCLLYSVK